MMSEHWSQNHKKKKFSVEIGFLFTRMNEMCERRIMKIIEMHSHSNDTNYEYIIMENYKAHSRIYQAIL